MSALLPDPMTPPDCDLRGYEFMPLFGSRLFGSEFDAQASDLEFRVAIRLWWAAWLQCPAGSLPTDDGALCRLADLGRDLKTWKKIRPMVLRHFTLCSDGRLYHPLLCMEAKVAFEKRRKDRERKANMRANKRTGETPDGNGSGVSSPSVPRMSHGTAALVPRTNGSGPTDVPTDNGHLSAGNPTEFMGLSHGPSADFGVDSKRQEVSKEVSKKEAATAFSVTPRESGELPVDANPGSVVLRDIKLMPKRSDPEHRWMAVGDGQEVENDPDTLVPTTYAMRNGWRLKVIAELICQAAMIHQEDWQGDWWTVTAWLDDGINPHETIIPAIRRMASRPGFTGVGRLAYFDARIRETWQNSNVVRFG